MQEGVGVGVEDGLEHANSEHLIIDSPRLGDEAMQRALLSAAGDSVRLRILALLRRPTPVHTLCDQLAMAQPRVSHHLAVLRDAGLVRAERSGRQRLYAWESDPSSPLVQDLQALLRRWLRLSPDTERPVFRGVERAPSDSRGQQPKEPRVESPSRESRSVPAPGAAPSPAADRSASRSSSPEIEDFLL